MYFPDQYPHMGVFQAAVKYASKLHDGHSPGCPWVRQSCEESLLSYPPLPKAQVMKGFGARVTELQNLHELPGISAPAVSAVLKSHR